MHTIELMVHNQNTHHKLTIFMGTPGMHTIELMVHNQNTHQKLTIFT